ncbi:type II toxin-antitoxin system HicB family antitoxin [Planktothrix sp. FACHB-1365]|uniref:type II toxin-antitoxin system HicB family antitoxin n=1 Tax=Planktothrix sp. FACHB-1365 TaxID=2692855 RepID=UPI001689DEDE|nr:type II toxin-antitoxin system HicB family antitoxin [Planktothrix sp. FACHB-1365]MBD2482335.1 type II toxin-antitoxin system HicB family antitoxin [Planktothrix sp. FACHB-1365]
MGKFLEHLTIETEQEEDGRWIAEIPEIPGVLVYGNSLQEVTVRVQALALRAIADKLEHGEIVPSFVMIQPLEIPPVV